MSPIVYVLFGTYEAADYLGKPFLEKTLLGICSTKESAESLAKKYKVNRPLIEEWKVL